MPHKTRIAEATTGTGAAGAATIETAVYHEYLTHNFLFAVSYAEWFKILAAAYVSMLIIKTLWGFFRWIKKKVSR